MLTPEGVPVAGLGVGRAGAEPFPEAPLNQLAVGEALGKNGASGEAHAAYQRAFDLAIAAVEAGNPEADRWRAEASAGLERYSGR